MQIMNVRFRRGGGGIAINGPIWSRLFLVLLVFLGGPISEAKEKPFKGGAVGRVIEAEMFAAPEVGGGAFLRERAEAEGVFTHMGNSQVFLEWVVSLEMVEGELVYVLEGVFQTVAANGDSMTGTFWSRQKASGSSYEIVVTVTEGSGRFAGAQGTISGKGSREGDDFAYFLDGRCNYGEGN